MPCACETTDLSPLETLLANKDSHGGNLITVLQKTQEIYGYLPKPALLRVAEALEIKPAQLMGVASFYTQFRMAPAGRYVIQLCHGTACHVNGAEEVGRAITETLGITDGQTTEDGRFTLMDVACLGCCSLSPVMTVNGEPHGWLTPDSARQIINGLGESE